MVTASLRSSRREYTKVCFGTDVERDSHPCQHIWPVDRQAAWILGVHRSTPPPCRRTLADDQNGMQAPASAIGLLVSLTLAWSSDKTRERGVHISIAMILSFAGTLWLALAPDSAGKRVLYGGYLMTAGTMATGQAINAVCIKVRARG
jgi:hypothetical protein